jgi:aerobic carbon-monoxide dehydrogenase medium subunit
MYQTTYHRAASVDEAAALFAKSKEAKYLAGGHSLIPVMKHRLASPSDVIDISGISNLMGVEASRDTLTIKAATTHFDVATSPAVQAAIPALAYLASVIGDPAVRHRGTLGGSLANNDPAADYPAAVLALGATVKTNKRSIKADDFFKGLFATALQDDEIITAVSFPIPAQAGYSKFPHPASRFALTGVFVTMTKSGDVRAAATGASQSGVMRLPAIEAALKANWSAAALDNVAIATAGLISDIHGSADYRANLIKVMAQRAVAAPGRANAGTATPIASPAVASPRVIGTAAQSAAQTPRSPLRRLLSGLIGKPGG